MKQLGLLAGLLLLSPTTWAQSRVADSTLVQNHTAQIAPIRGNAWEAIEHPCLFAITCPEFAREAVKQHGFLKGSLLALDRRTRCNRAHLAETSPLRKNREGKIIDPPSQYAWRE